MPKLQSLYHEVYLLKARLRHEFETTGETDKYTQAEFELAYKKLQAYLANR